MRWQFPPYLIPLLAATFFLITLALYAWRRRQAPAALPFAAVATVAAMHALAYALELASADLSVKLFWTKIARLGIVTLPTAWLTLVFHYTGREKWLTRRNLALLSIEPLISLLLAWTNAHHGLVYSAFVLDESGPFVTLESTWSLWSWIDLAYAYVLIGASIVLLLRALTRAPRTHVYRNQILVLLASVLAPLAAGGLSASDLNPVPSLTLTPFVFALTVPLVAWSVFRFRMLDALPVTRAALRETKEALRASEERYRTLIENIPVGVYRNTPGPQGRFIIANPAFLRMFGIASKQELADFTVADLYVNPAERKPFSDNLLAQGSVTGVQLYLKKRDGTPLWASVSARVVYAEGDGETVFFDCTIEDITKRKLVEAALQDRERFLATLNEITRTALETPDLTAMTQTLADRLGELFSADGCYITLWDEAAQRTPCTTAAHGALRETYPAQRSPPSEQTMTASVLRAGHTLVAQDVFDTPYVSPRIAAKYPARSLLGLPLIADGEKLGAALIAFNQPHDFTPEEITRGEQVAGQIALALAKARRLDREREQRQRAEALADITLTLAAHTDYRAVLDEILHQAQRLVPHTTTNIGLLKGNTLHTVHWRGYDEFAPEWEVEIPQLSQPLAEWPVDAQAVRSREPVIVPDTRQEPDWVAVEGSGWIRSYLAMPICLRDRVMGLLRLDSDTPDRFSAQDARRLGPLANAAAIAIENARLLEETRQRADELEMLRHVGLQISSLLDLSAVLDTITQSALSLVGATDCHIYLYDADTERFTFGAALWQDGRREPAVSAPRSDGLTATVARSGIPVVIDDAPRHPLYTSPEANRWGVQAIAGFPLQRADRVVGVFSVTYLEPHTFDKEELRILALLADQAAIAIDNAQLYRQARQEITERKRAQEALRRRADELRALHATTLDITTVHNLPTLLHTIVERAARLVDVPSGGLYLCDPTRQEARCVVSYNTPSDYTGTVLKYGEGAAGVVAQTGEPLIIEDYRVWSGRATTFEGEQPFSSVLSAPMIWQGQVTGVIHVLHNVETRSFNTDDLALLTLFANQAAIAVENARLVQGLEDEVDARTAEIVAEKEKSDAILSSVGDAIAVTDLEMRIQYVNDAFVEITGYTAQEAKGQWANTLVGAGMSEQSQEAIRAALVKGEAWRGEVTIRRKDGRTYDAALTTAPMHDAHGRLVAYVSSHRDISYLREMDRARSRFLSHVSHELRTPVTNLKLYTHLLEKAPSPEKTETYIQVLGTQVERLIALVQDILEITMLDSGLGIAAWEPVILSPVIDEAVTRYQSQAQAAQLDLAVAPLPPDLPTIMGDPARLAQALGELIENAIIFSSPGGAVSVETGTIKIDGQRWVTLAVHDTGPGISPEEQAQVFDRLFRGELAESGIIPGTGLGLSIADEILRAHGGFVTVESQPGQGSAFTLYLRQAPMEYDIESKD